MMMGLNNTDEMIRSVCLGQAGFKFQVGEGVLYIDPYLSDSVERLEGSHLKRQVPVKIAPDQIHDADWVLITHSHMDHCDLDTLIPLASASPQARFIGPNEVCEYLIINGFSKNRVLVASDDWMELNNHLRLHAVPAAHPRFEKDERGFEKYLGYIIEYKGKRIYHSGDTFLNQQLIDAVHVFKPIETALLPVNEHNYAREKMGIVGNMGLRDAFEFATILEVKKLIPIHWDMFAPNAVFPEEIELLYQLLKPSFKMELNPTEL